MKYYLILLICGWFPWYFAQSDVFETDGKGNRDIERTLRIPSAPKIIDSIKTSAVPNRPLLGPKLTVNVTTDTIDAATIETEQLLEKIYPFYLKLGMGSTFNGGFERLSLLQNTIILFNWIEINHGGNCLFCF